MYWQTVMVLVLFGVLSLVICSKEYDSSGFESKEGHFQPDLVAAESGHHGHGRVQIKVYRGPSEGHDHKHFAPHGYWVKQPADHHH